MPKSSFVRLTASVSIITLPELGTINLYHTSPLLGPSQLVLVILVTLEFVAPTFVPSVKEQLVPTVKVGVPVSHGLSFGGTVEDAFFK